MTKNVNTNTKASKFTEGESSNPYNGRLKKLSIMNKSH